MSSVHHAKRLYVGTTAERTALSLTADGRGIVWYDTDQDRAYIWSGSAWVETTKVSELWESDGGAVAWSTDASGHLSATGKNLTTTGSIFVAGITATGNINLPNPTAVQGTGSSNPTLGASPSGNRWGDIYLASATFINALGNLDISTGAIGSDVVMIRLTNAAQDILKLGGVDGDDVDVNINNGQVFVEGSSGKVGIGTTTIGGIGAALLALKGTASSVAAGPHMQFTVNTSDYPKLQFLPYADDNINIVFDAAFGSGGWISSDAGSNFLITKINDKMHIQSDIGIAQGSVITWDALLSFDPTNIRLGINNASPLKLLHVGPGTDATFQSYDGLYVAINDFAQVAVRNNSTNVEGGMFAHTSAFYMGTWTNHGLIFDTNNTDALAIDTSQNVGIGITSGLGAKLHVDQASTTAAIPVVSFDQADLSEEFIEFITTVGAGNPIDTAAIGTYYGKARVSVAGVGFKYIALYDS